MAEVISDEQPRIKFSAQRDLNSHAPPKNPVCDDLSSLMSELECSGAIPVLNDGLVAGNCAVSARLILNSVSKDSSGNTREQLPDTAVYVSRSGKPPGARMAAQDFVLVTGFDPQSWSVQYRSSGTDIRPTSDTPLHIAALDCTMTADYGWEETPLVAAHGHALAEGEGASPFALENAQLFCRHAPGLVRLPPARALTPATPAPTLPLLALASSTHIHHGLASPLKCTFNFPPITLSRQSRCVLQQFKTVEGGEAEGAMLPAVLHCRSSIPSVPRTSVQLWHWAAAFIAW